MTDRRRAGDILLRHWLLCALVLAGTVLRAGSTLADRPAVMLYGDSYSFLIIAQHLGPDGFHPLIYSAFLWALWWTGNVTWVVIVQHMLVVLLSVLIYATLRRLGVRPWLAALGVAPLLLDAYQIFLEQNILSDTLLEVLGTAGLLVIMWSPRDRLRWATGAVAGLCIGLAILTRGVALVAVPVACVVLLLSGRGWRQPAAILLTSILLVGGYSAWNYSVKGQFTFDEMSGRWLYGRIAVVGNCHHVRGIPQDERVLCDTRYGPDPKGYAPIDRGVAFYVWDPNSPWNRLRPGPHQDAYQMAEDYSLRVILGDPGPYLLSVLRDTTQYFAPTRQAVAAGGAPLAGQSFQPVMNPAQTHVLLAPRYSMAGDAASFGRGLSTPQAARWPIWWLYHYQTFGYTPGPVLAACLLLMLVAAAWGSRDARGRAQREAALLSGLTGFLMVLFPAAAVGVEVRYLLPALPLIPPAGVLAVEALIGPAKRAVDRLREPTSRGERSQGAGPGQGARAHGGTRPPDREELAPTRIR